MLMKSELGARLYIQFALIAIALAGCGRSNPFASDNSHGAIGVCEEALLEKLKAPATYQRVTADFFEKQPFSRTEFQEYTITKFCGVGAEVSPCTEVNNLMVTMGAKDLGDKRGLGIPTRAQVRAMRKLYWDQAFAGYQARPIDFKRPSTVIIKYDADNSFGTPIRGSEVCTFGPRYGDKLTASDLYDASAAPNAAE